MNIVMFSHLVSMIIIFGKSLLYYSILTILLKLVLSSRFWLIIQWIISNLWLIIRWMMLSIILKIMILFSFTKTMCFCNYYISVKLFKTCTHWWRSTNNYNIFIFNMWFIAILANIFGRVWCTVRFKNAVVLVGYP